MTRAKKKPMTELHAHELTVEQIIEQGRATNIQAAKRLQEISRLEEKIRIAEHHLLGYMSHVAWLEAQSKSAGRFRMDATEEWFNACGAISSAIQALGKKR